MNMCQVLLDTTVDWQCPECGHSNTDSYAITQRPKCGDCDLDFDWRDLLTTSEIAHFNKVMLDYSLGFAP